jgi:hypothetical protein
LQEKKIEPHANRVLLRAVTRAELMGLAVPDTENILANAAYYVLEACGPMVSEVTKERIGQKLLHISTAGDSIHSKYLFVREDHILCWINE